jgi:hypothetical protein
MRLYEITTVDPILSDAKTVAVISRYMGPDIVKQIEAASPYNPASAYKQYKGIYDRIAKRVVPMCQIPNPDIPAIISAVNKELPLVSLPAWVQQSALHAQAILQGVSHGPSDTGGQTWTMPAD